MTTFTIDGFAKDCKAAMANAEDKQQAAREYLQSTLNANDLNHIVKTLEAAIPEGADVGEMIVHASPELTMMYARVPGRFQSGIHNHTVFACIGQLTGSEKSVVYQQQDHGLSVKEEMTSEVGQVVSLPADAIHHIENPHDSVSGSLHIYGGDFGALMDERSLWSYDDHEEKGFSFQELVKESIKGMRQNNNQVGLDELVKAIPAVKPMVEA
jgi:predicted metal-dependent enzyme (double-stranded beta helix superfamily)